MTRQEYVDYCKECKHKEFSPENGIICGLTGKIADFEGECLSFEENPNAPKILMEEKLEEKKADLGLRFANYIIDIIFYLFLAFLVGIGIGLYIKFVDYSASAMLDGNRIGFRIIMYVVLFLYYSSFEALFGKTIGKLITGTKVVNIEDGEKPTFGTAMLRSIIRFVPFEAFSFFGEHKTGWHDRWSKTLVIKDRN